MSATAGLGEQQVSKTKSSLSCTVIFTVPFYFCFE